MRGRRFRLELSREDSGITYLYILPEGAWQGHRMQFHAHEGPCTAVCGSVCGGYDPLVAELAEYLGEWMQRAYKGRFGVRPTDVKGPISDRLDRMEQAVAAIAKGLRKPKRRAR